MTRTGLPAHAARSTVAAPGDARQPLLYQRIVMKAGTAILSGGGEDSAGVNLAVLSSIVRQICQLREQRSRGDAGDLRGDSSRARGPGP